MPELPEVEIIARSLREGTKEIPGLPGQTVSGAEVFWRRTLEYPTYRNFNKCIEGQEIKNVGRRGKFVVIELTDATLLIHLRMSGDLRLGMSGQDLGDHVRLAVHTNEGYQLAFNNPRKFGRVWLLENPDSVLGRLGPEPLDPMLSGEQFYQTLTRRKRQIKPLLLDQNFIAGLGNIYSDEALHLARIHPLTQSNTLTEVQANELLCAIREVLLKGIHLNGASIDWVYQGGDFQNHFRVYQRTGEPCFVCNAPITRIIVGQRGTHICNACQMLPE
jgi:formamidopyrimidine-DNA glycosylase